MSDGAQSSTMRRGGFVAVLLLLFGGFGLYFGPGRGKSSSKANQNNTASVNSNANVKKPARRRPEPRSLLVNASQPTPIRDNANTQPPSNQNPQVRPNTPKGPAVNKYAYTYILRLRYIHPLKADGTMSEKTVSLEDLVKQGQKARSAKQELHLRLRGDARAKWVTKVKEALKDNKVVFSLTNEF
ncbi:MAG: hypothetical protein EP343_17110 [Deltaproteobacteria bacterium]|nr:MAG: hypothetical protein EP343_17110 [Deltaproteobacteria bacterium]